LPDVPGTTSSTAWAATILCSAGGAGRDIFRFENVNESNLAATDTILDFRAGGEADRIDLSAIDAKSGTAANDAFVFIGTNTAFTGAGGEVRVTHSNGQWFVEADVDGDMVADLLIRIDNGVGHVFTAGDFML
jgi:Ca2+-binding RTX toxin-like protein